MHVYEVKRRKDRRGFDLIINVLAFGRLWYADPDAASNAVRYAKFNSQTASDMDALQIIVRRKVCETI